MNIIYEPKGKAREYSPLALNIYNGCSHCCKYCYVRNINSLLSSEKPVARKNILQELQKFLSKSVPKKQVLLSFVSDIYCPGTTITRDILKILLEYQVPTAILTKNKNVLNDLDLFKRFHKIKVGMTLTFTNYEDAKYYEPGASLPYERFETLEILNKEGVKTFASLEPVIKPEQSLEIIDITYKFVDLFKIGKINYYDGIDKTIDWTSFAKRAVEKCIVYKKDFYIKNDLQVYCHNLKLDKKNIDSDYWALVKENEKPIQGELF